ncbi:hypothetical protein BV898_05221 [Hypsibius exemplaris]|uniref:Uncharacterized protein n=1 Tax=Hypsibius exemplaris TaxID=2072580 RepID=A0A1W0X093_HYPEX|nr:hypothetical protein BV898_05221 [Hypsibius exemplaris]
MMINTIILTITRQSHRLVINILTSSMAVRTSTGFTITEEEEVPSSAVLERERRRRESKDKVPATNQRRHSSPKSPESGGYMLSSAGHHMYHNSSHERLKSRQSLAEHHDHLISHSPLAYHKDLSNHQPPKPPHHIHHEQQKNVPDIPAIHPKKGAEAKVKKRRKPRDGSLYTVGSSGSKTTHNKPAEHTSLQLHRRRSKTDEFISHQLHDYSQTDDDYYVAHHYFHDCCEQDESRNKFMSPPKRSTRHRSSTIERKPQPEQHHHHQHVTHSPEISPRNICRLNRSSATEGDYYNANQLHDYHQEEEHKAHTIQQQQHKGSTKQRTSVNEGGSERDVQTMRR